MSGLPSIRRLYRQEHSEPTFYQPRRHLENTMNREFNASSKPVRSILAVAAVLATVLVASSIEGLSQHYGAQAELAASKAVTVAQR
jgi:hypothetical protein